MSSKIHQDVVLPGSWGFVTDGSRQAHVLFAHSPQPVGVRLDQRTSQGERCICMLLSPPCPSSEAVETEKGVQAAGGFPISAGHHSIGKQTLSGRIAHLNSEQPRYETETTSLTLRQDMCTGCISIPDDVVWGDSGG